MPENIFTEEYPGRCISCGFLNNAFPSLRPQEVEIGQRRRGEPSMYMHCFRALASKANLTQELADAGANKAHDAANPTARSEAFSVVLKKKRGKDGCPAWFEYVPTYDPQWHYERWREMDVEQRRKEWEGKQEAARRRFEVTLFVVALAVALLAFTVAIASVPKDSWVLCDLNVHCANTTAPTPMPQSTPVTIRTP